MEASMHGCFNFFSVSLLFLNLLLLSLIVENFKKKVVLRAKNCAPGSKNGCTVGSKNENTAGSKNEHTVVVGEIPLMTGELDQGDVEGQVCLPPPARDQQVKRGGVLLNLAKIWRLLSDY